MHLCIVLNFLPQKAFFFHHLKTIYNEKILEMDGHRPPLLGTSHRLLGLVSFEQVQQQI
jgi:hypothetical protein